MARHRSQRILELHATTSLARLWQRQGRRGEACQKLGEIYGWFTEGFDTTTITTAQHDLTGLTAVTSGRARTTREACRGG